MLILGSALWVICCVLSYLFWRACDSLLGEPFTVGDRWFNIFTSLLGPCSFVVAVVFYFAVWSIHRNQKASW